MSRTVRTPGVYNKVDAVTDKELDAELFKTCEFMHPSIRWRWQIAEGPGLSQSSTDLVGKGVYQPAAMKNWSFLKPGPLDEAVFGKHPELKKWDNNGKWVSRDDKGDYTFIVEERIEGGTFEDELVSGWRDVKAKLQT
jgi:hypothetical protein